MMRNCRVMLVMAFLCSACATEAAYTQNVRSWVGKSQGNLIYVWGEPTRIEGADAFPEDGRSGEGLLDRHLLVDREADEQRERVGREERTGRRVVGEPERRCGGHLLRVPGRRPGGRGPL